MSQNKTNEEIYINHIAEKMNTVIDQAKQMINDPQSIAYFAKPFFLAACEIKDEEIAELRTKLDSALLLIRRDEPLVEIQKLKQESSEATKMLANQAGTIEKLNKLIVQARPWLRDYYDGYESEEVVEWLEETESIE